MKKFIKVVLLINNVKPKTIEIESTRDLHETEVYSLIEDMFPYYVHVDWQVDEDIEAYPEGYKVEYKNGLHSIAIYKGQ